MIVVVYNQIHLEIPKPFPICLFGALMYTGSAGDGRSLAFGSVPVLELMARMASLFPSRIGMYDIVDALMRHADTPPFSKPLIFAVETIAPRGWFVLFSIPVQGQAQHWMRNAFDVPWPCHAP